ncbi:aromatic compound catabolic protein [Enterococcus plantarum]|uniref:PaaI family thioesterase n=1 Tax=Enterococcus TaxID=1350 RepID=UPI00084D656E|nr:PaaI family thioesterase [Enterococcus plantarum]MBO0422806.1 PaaI family thioesterase [Enterococcus plantarum]OEG18758.1 aromatic compound catabolic protein [Enterococcus plantarum]
MHLLDYLNIETTELSKEKVVLTMDIKEFHKQPYGILHGGMNGILIETACSLGANEQLDAQSYAVGLDLQINHLKSVPSGLLTVIATADRIGQSIQVWEGKIFNDANELTAVGRCTLMSRQIDK